MKPDLNLLVILDALCRHGSVSRAAERLALSQPAISHALNRLRAATGDPLFTRSGRGLVPTPHALALAERVAGIVAEAQACLRPEAFDPSRDAMTFRLGVSDFAGLTLLPQVVQAAMSEAKQVRIEAVPVGPGLLRQLEEGGLDVSFWGTDPLAAPYHHQALFEDEYRLVMRHAHPALKAGSGRIGLEDYLDLSHAVVSLGDPGTSGVETALAHFGRTRRIVLVSPSFAANLAAVAASDLAATVPDRLALALPEGLVRLPLPFNVPRFRYGLIWHARTDASPAQRWFRALIARVVMGNAIGLAGQG